MTLHFRNNIAAETFKDREGKRRTRYVARIKVLGKYKQLKFATRAAATDWLDHCRLLNAGVARHQPTASDGIGAIFEAKLTLMEQEGAKENTVRSFEGARKAILAFFSEKQAHVLSDAQALAYTAHRREQGVQDQTIIRDFHRLREATREVLRITDVGWRIPKTLSRKKVTKKQQHLKYRDAAAVLSVVDGVTRLRVLFGLLCGLRQVDISTFSIDQLWYSPIDWETTEPSQRLWQLTQVKTGEPIHVYVPKMVNDEILASSVDGPLIAYRNRSGEGKYLRSRTQDLGLTNGPLGGISILRNTAATWLGMAEMSNAEIGIFLGHRQLSVAAESYNDAPNVGLRVRATAYLEHRLAWAVAQRNGVQIEPPVLENQYTHSILSTLKTWQNEPNQAGENTQQEPN